MRANAESQKKRGKVKIKDKYMYPGIANNNPGNLRPSVQKWQGQTGVRNNLVVFDTMQNGVRALAKDVLNTVKAGYDTPKKFFAHYAPRNENPTDNYTNFVAERLGIKVDDKIIMPNMLHDMVQYIIIFENGKEYGLVSQADIQAGIDSV